MDSTPAPAITPADTITPWYLDKAFIAIMVHLVAVIVLAVFHIQVSEATVAADASLLITFILAHKAKSGLALLALIKAMAASRYTTAAPIPLPDAAKVFDKPPAVGVAPLAMLAVFLLGALAFPAFADEPPAPPAGHSHLVLRKGDPAPADGIFADSDLVKYDLERLRWLEAYGLACQDVAQTNSTDARTWPWLVGGGLGVVVGVAAGLIVHQQWMVAHGR